LTEKLLLALIVAGLVAPVATHYARKALVTHWSTFFERDVPALLLSGALNAAAALAVLAYFSDVTLVGGILAFCVAASVAHYFYKVVWQKVVDTVHLRF
jgi:hypothetical protein